MSEKPVATPRGSTTDNKTKDLACQTGTAAHTDTKAQFGEVSNLHRALSYVQHQTIRALLKPDSYVSQRGCTNATLSALEKRKLVTLHFVTVKTEYGPYQATKWSLTALGRKVAQL